MKKFLIRASAAMFIIAVSLSPYSIRSSSSAGQPGSNPVNPTPKIAFASDRDSFPTKDIFVMNADGSEIHNITNHRAEDLSPSWSPDGSKILFIRYNYFYIMNADGTELTQLVEIDSAFNPVWSPDGLKIAYQLFSGETNLQNYSIWVMNADGTQHIKLTDHPGADTHPTWSPDGEKIAFSREWNDSSDIYVINLDGTGETNLTNNSAWDSDPDFSPDGSRIAFVSYRDKISRIWVMNSDGSEPKVVSYKVGYLWQDDSDPDWSADGSKIIFSRNTIKSELFVTNMDGSCQGKLTEISPYISSQGDISPVWQPVISDSPLPYFCLYQPITIK